MTSIINWYNYLAIQLLQFIKRAVRSLKLNERSKKAIICHVKQNSHNNLNFFAILLKLGTTLSRPTL